MNFEFNLKTKTIVGTGSVEKVFGFLEEQKHKRVGLIIDQALKNNSYVNSFVEKLRSHDLVAVCWYYDLPFEPDYNSLDRIKLLFKDKEDSRVDILIAIGGGSVLDFGKGIATLIYNHDAALQYRGFPKNLNPSVPLIAIPTTAGTASEVTFNAVFTDTEGGKKLGINTHNNFPVMAILDSNFTRNSPYNVALSSGLDALVHTFESFATTNQNPYTRMFAREAFKFLFNNIEEALNSDSDEARENMLFGAYLAGISLFNSGSGPAGALSYPLGVVFKVPHGIAGGFVLPYLIQHNVQANYLDYAELYNQIKGANVSLSAGEKSKALAKAFFELYDRLGVWEKATKFDVDPDKKEFLDYVGLLQPAFNQNPLPFTIEDGMNIVRKIFKQK
jgi:alcohol dehydrogenase class IV